MEKITQMAPEIDFVYGVLWQIHHRKGDGARAYESLRKFLGMHPRRADFIEPVESAYRLGGWPAALSAYPKQRAANVPEGYWPGHYFMAALSVYAGDREQAFRSLEDAVKFRLYDVPFMRFNPALEPLRSDPRFADLIKRSGVK